MANTAVRANPDGFRREITRPRRPLPPDACDCHMHIAGPFERFPISPLATLHPPPALVGDYRRVMATLGLSRTVVVQPSFFARDNRCTLDATSALGGQARAIVVVDSDTPAAELRRMHETGARGVRLHTIAGGGVSFDALETMAAAIAPLGWHLQLWLDARDLPDIAPRLRRLPVPVVFDHMLSVDPASGTDEPGFTLMLKLLETGRFWVKLSNGRVAPDDERARRVVAANPERALWGSDWPHVSHEGAPPDDGALLDRLWDWVPDDATHQAILSDNPARLYFTE